MKNKLLITSFVVTLLLAMTFTTASAEPPADILDSYTVAITPQQDGSWLMSYQLTGYCTYSDWPSDLPYLQIGVPNSKFAITDWGPKEGANRVVGADPITVGGSFVQLNFDQSNLPKNGACFDLYFSIVQNKMAYSDPENGNITFKFIPAGWDFPIKVNLLTVLWASPATQSLVKIAEPSPSITDGNMMWQWANPTMNAAGMFSDATIKLAYDKSAFQLSELATSQQEGGGESFDWKCFWTVVIIIGVILLILFLLAVWNESYRSGDGVGPAIVTVLDDVGEVLDDLSSTSDSDGDSSSGHSSSCACASCACACACAGGTKVGCSRKSIGISCLPQVAKSITSDTKT